MKKVVLIAVLAMIFASCVTIKKHHNKKVEARKEKAQLAKEKKDQAKAEKEQKEALEKKEAQAVIFGVLNLTNTVGYDDLVDDLVSISFIYSGNTLPTVDEIEDIQSGKPWLPDGAQDVLAKINKKDFDKMKAENKAYWVHAKWVMQKGGRLVDVDPPKNLSKPGSKICLVFQYGKLEDLNKNIKLKKEAETKTTVDDPQKKSEIEDEMDQQEEEVIKKTEKKSPCARTEAYCAKLKKKLNPKTCDCE